MKVSRILAVAAIGAGIAALLRTQKGRQLTKELSDNAGHWKDIWSKMAGDKLTQVKDTLSREVRGLSTEARLKINKILDETQESVKRTSRKIPTGNNQS